MKKNSCLPLFFVCTFLLRVSEAQTIIKPENYLGYELGTAFTPHHKIVSYIEALAKQRPQNVQIVRYGTTNELRPLLVAIFAKPEVLKNIEDLRLNHLRNMDLAEGQPQPEKTAIAWLSYNVHGNEAVSSEVAMQLAYDLLDENNETCKDILANTVVILDPCINPDGHDRYVNWYNQKMGVIPNPLPEAVEHQEPWPGGRFNHYFFDLNRDWAWQTQVESQQRIKLYQQWLPHLHADFHEMGVDSPYYFAPSAKPFHKDITAWQRQMQDTLGRYFAKIFDKNNWMYYTRENFDLLYPSYGDTYPTYFGAIGYTIEQGGAGRAGLATLTTEGDTLTLKQRIAHHHATSIGSLLAVANNTQSLIEEQVLFYQNAQMNPQGVYKSFVFKSKGNEGKLREFKEYLDKNDYKYGYVGQNFQKQGFSYINHKHQQASIEKGDLVVNLYQPRSTMLKILLEPHTFLEDSVTYDITAWSLPYAYGLDGYAFSEKIEPDVNYQKPIESIKELYRPYAYLARWNTFTDARFMVALLKKGIRVRSSEKNFTTNGQEFLPGTLVITRTGNEKLGKNFDDIIKAESLKYSIEVVPVSTGFVSEGSDFGSANVGMIMPVKIAIMAGEGTLATDVGDVWHFFDKQLGYPVSIISTDDFAPMPIDSYNVLIFPAGNYTKMLTETTMDKLKSWIKAGGRLVAIEGALNSFAGKADFLLKQKGSEEKKDDKKEIANFKLYADREREAISETTSGSIYNVNLDNTHPLAFGYEDSYAALILTADSYDYLKGGWNVGYTEENDYITGFAGKNAKEKIKNSLIFGVQEMGKGKVVFLNNNLLFRGFWQNGKLLFTNAVFMLR